MSVGQVSPERWAIRAIRDRTPDNQRRERMNAANPNYVMRSYLTQIAIDQAEAGDSSLVEELLDVIQHPYEGHHGREQHAEERPTKARLVDALLRLLRASERRGGVQVRRTR
jgi:serine/tyrosine/threonine adenylyltransferase